MHGILSVLGRRYWSASNDQAASSGSGPASKAPTHTKRSFMDRFTRSPNKERSKQSTYFQRPFSSDFPIEEIDPWFATVQEVVNNETLPLVREVLDGQTRSVMKLVEYARRKRLKEESEVSRSRGEGEMGGEQEEQSERERGESADEGAEEEQEGQEEEDNSGPSQLTEYRVEDLDGLIAMFEHHQLDDETITRVCGKGKEVEREALTVFERDKWEPVVDTLSNGTVALAEALDDFLSCCLKDKSDTDCLTSWFRVMTTARAEVDRIRLGGETGISNSEQTRLTKELSDPKGKGKAKEDNPSPSDVSTMDELDHLQAMDLQEDMELEALEDQGELSDPEAEFERQMRLATARSIIDERRKYAPNWDA